MSNFPLHVTILTELAKIFSGREPLLLDYYLKTGNFNQFLFGPQAVEILVYNIFPSNFTPQMPVEYRFVFL